MTRYALIDTLVWAPAITMLSMSMAFTFVAWRLERRAGAPVLLALWCVVSLLLGYAFYLGHCRQGFTCDGGAQPMAYFKYYFPAFTLMWALALGATGATVIWLQRRSEASHPLGRDYLASGATFVVGWMVAMAILAVFNHATCGSRSIRRPDRTYGPACESHAPAV